MRVVNFNPGPSVLPEEVLAKVKDEMLEYRGTGMSVMEMSHRSAEFEQILDDAKKNLRSLMSVSDAYEILFLQGGASQQFFMLPMNFLAKDKKADYVDTGEWASKAIKEAKLFGTVNVLYTGKDMNYARVPAWDELKHSPDAVYCHVTSNNTIFGTRCPDFSGYKGPVRLAADMSSDILTRPFDIEKFCFIYAGAQKNLGPSGVTLVVIRKDFAEKALPNVPTLLQYKTHMENNSLYNTPPTFAIYIVKLVTEWGIQKGGLPYLEKECRRRADMVYKAVDESAGFYRATADKASRSLTNITFRLSDEATEKKFTDEAKKLGLMGLKGHRKVGGIRVSNYNAMPLAGIEKLVGFMADFQKRNR